MSHKNIIIFLLLVSINAKGQFRLPEDLGEGHVAIKISWIPLSDTVKMDATKSTFMTFDYHVNHTKVFRQGDAQGFLLDSSKKSVSLQNGASVQSSFQAHVIVPTYLLDWKTKMVYTYPQQQRRSCVYEDSLKDNSDEMFYKGIYRHKRNNHFIIDTARQNPVVLAGIHCFAARYRKSDNGRWFQFVYTTQKLPLYSPVNAFFDADFPYQVMSIDVLNQMYVKGVLTDASYFRIAVTSITGEKQDAKLFELPPRADILKRTPDSEIHKN